MQKFLASQLPTPLFTFTNGRYLTRRDAYKVTKHLLCSLFAFIICLMRLLLIRMERFRQLTTQFRYSIEINSCYFHWFVYIIIYEPQLFCTLEVLADHCWKFRIQGKQIDLSHTHLNYLPSKLQSAAAVSNLLQAINSCCYCSGNEDKRFFPLQASRKGMFMDASGNFNATFRYS
jgi:hypothetical protein